MGGAPRRIQADEADKTPLCCRMALPSFVTRKNASRCFLSQVKYTSKQVLLRLGTNNTTHLRFHGGRRGSHRTSRGCRGSPGTSQGPCFDPSSRVVWRKGGPTPTPSVGLVVELPTVTVFCCADRTSRPRQSERTAFFRAHALGTARSDACPPLQRLERVREETGAPSAASWID